MISTNIKALDLEKFLIGSKPDLSTANGGMNRIEISGRAENNIVIIKPNNIPSAIAGQAN